MAQSMTCPHCGAALEITGPQATMRCAYCNNPVVVPEAVQQADASIRASQSMSRTMRYLLIFLVLVIGVPTCVSLAGTVLGVLASVAGVLVGIAAPLLAVVLQYFVRQ